jgi:hypothetical protein
MYKKLFHSCLLGSLSTTAILAEEPGPNQIVQTGGSMCIIFKTSLIILSVACLAACSSSESDSHKKAVEDLKKDTNRISEAIKKSNEISLDHISSGGQPGKVILEGALVSDNTNTDPRIVVNVQTGKGWRGQRAELSASTIQLKQKVSDYCYHQKFAPFIKARETFVNLGCDLTDRNDLAGLEEKKIEAFSTPYINAEIVLLCDGSQIEKNVTTFICADTVVFGSLKLEMTGSGDKLANLSIYSNKLVVDGDSVILSKGKDGPYTIYQREPSVLISAIALSGNGKIKIDFSGANYAAEEKK